MNSTLRAVVIGCGFISDYHIEAWKKTGVNVIAVCDKNISLAKLQAKNWRISKYYDDISQMIGEDFEIASICTPPQVRSEVVIPLIENEKHVVIEKPFTLSVAEALKIMEIKQRYKVKLTVTHNWLFSYVMKKTLNVLKNNQIGEVLGAQIEVLSTPRNTMTSNPTHWSHSLKGGSFAEMLPHPLYILQTILGKLDIRYILGSKLGKYYWMPIDELWILLENQNARTASIHTSFNTTRSEVILNIYADKKILNVNLYKQILIIEEPLEISHDRKIVQTLKDNFRILGNLISSNVLISSAILTGQYQGMYANFMKEFVKCLAENTDPPVTAEEALQVTKTYEDLCSGIHSLYFHEKV